MSSSTNPQEQGSQIGGSDDPQLTVGLELEGHFAALIDGKDDPNPALPKNMLSVKSEKLSEQEHIKEAKRFLGIIVKNVGGPKTGINIRKVDEEHPVKDPPDNKTPGEKVDEEHPVKNPPHNKTTGEGSTLGPLENGIYAVYKRWAAAFDASGKWYKYLGEYPKEWLPPLGSGGRYTWFSLEFKSRVYYSRELSTLRIDLENFCRELVNRFRVSIKCGRGDARPSAHVHVGYPNPNQGPDSDSALDLFTDIHIKRLMTLVWINEPAIMALHATAREDHIRYGSLLREHSHLAYFIGRILSPASPAYDRTTRAERIDETCRNLAHNLSVDETLRTDFEANIPPLPKPQSSSKGPEDIDALITGVKIAWGAKNRDQLAAIASSQSGERRPGFSLRELFLY